MIELPMVFLAGLLGSSHCVGMCGGFALMLGLRAKSPWHNCGVQLVYSAGRLFTYTVLGCVAGYFGGRLAVDWSTWLNVPAVLSLLAGVFLIYQGLLAAGIQVGGTAVQGTSATGCLSGSLLKTFMTSSHMLNRFLAGVLTGLLPCGLLYGALALAGASGSLVYGPLMMFCFGLGTVPLMVVTGVGGSLLKVATRTKLLRAAAWCVVLTGVLTVARGAGFLSIPGSVTAGKCPLCREASPVLRNEEQHQHPLANSSNKTTPNKTTPNTNNHVD